MKLLIAGDFCINNRLKDEKVLNDKFVASDRLRSEILNADYSIINLECPILEKPLSKIKKIGPAVYNSPSSIDVLHQLGFNCVTLANNHVNDYGKEGLLNTKRVCECHNIDIVGIGSNEKEAAKVLYKTINNEIVGIINCCEHEFSIATENSAGACALNICSQYYAIQEAKRIANYIIVIVHGGHEGWQYPSLRMQDTYRLFVDFGASAVINHHQHCWSGYEIYNNAPIFYGLGNFCFDWKGKTKTIWNEGYVVELDLSKNNTQFTIIPYNQCGDFPEIRDLNSEEIDSFDQNMLRINHIINTRNLLYGVNKEYYQKTALFYCDFARPFSNRVLLALKSRGLIPRFYSKNWKMRLLSIIQCESHREKFLASLRSKW